MKQALATTWQAVTRCSSDGRQIKASLVEATTPLRASLKLIARSVCTATSLGHYLCRGGGGGGDHLVSVAGRRVVVGIV